MSADNLDYKNIWGERIPEKYTQDIINRINAEIKAQKISPYKLSVEAKLSNSIFSHWKSNRVKQLSVLTIEKIAQVLKLKPEWLIYGKGEKYIDDTKKIVLDNIDIYEIVRYKLDDDELVEDLNVIEKTYISSSFILQNPEYKLISLKIDTDTAEPVIKSGDIVIVDTNNKKIEQGDDEIFMLISNKKLILAHIQVLFDSVFFHFFNEKYPNFSLDQLADKEKLQIVGKVIEVRRRF